jgi:hydrogenase large subunit
VEVDNNAVSNAWASCTMWRGIEKILRGRDPRDAWLFTQRFCGVCTTVHAMALIPCLRRSSAGITIRPLEVNVEHSSFMSYSVSPIKQF